MHYHKKNISKGGVSESPKIQPQTIAYISLLRYTRETISTGLLLDSLCHNGLYTFHNSPIMAKRLR